MNLSGKKESINNSILSGKKFIIFKRISKIKNNNVGIIQYKEEYPSISGIVKNNPPQAFLEVVRNDAIEIVTIKINEDPLLKIFFVFSKNIAIENGKTIFNQHPA